MPTKKSLLAGVFCLGLSVIMFEIALTRVFAIMMWHHFTYMVISIGLLGFGASGSLLTATRMGTNEAKASRLLVWTSLAYGASVVLAFCFATLVNIDSLNIQQDKKNFLALFFVYLIIFVPFLFGGLGIGLALTRFVKQVNRLYFADLVGSALGAGCSVLLLKSIGSSAAVVAAGGFGTLAAFCFSLGLPRRYLLLTVPSLLVALVTLVAFSGGSTALQIKALHWRVPFAPGKEAVIAEFRYQQWKLEGKLGDQDPKFVKLPSATAEVEVGPDVDGAPMIGGDMGLVDQRNIMGRSVGQDGGAPTMLYRGAADLTKFPFLDDTQAASAYVVHKASGRKDQQAMVIGVGGGVDVLVALANGATHVTAVELNTAMIDMVTDRYTDYLGGLFVKGKSALADQVDLVNSEGRAWLRSHDDKYDVIQMSGVDSYTALSSGAYTLSESYLYTVEAVQDFYAHLRPDGIVCYSRFIERAPKMSRETLRLANIACAGLRASGVADPAKHVCVLQGRDWASTMIKQSPFTKAEVAALRAFATREAFVGLIFDPLREPGTKYEPEPSHFALLQSLIQDPISGSVATFPDRDDGFRAFFAVAAEVARGKQPELTMLPAAMRDKPVAPTILGLAAALKPAILSQRDYVARTTDDFLRLLNADDAGRKAFYADYPFDVSPSTDDSPFFFNYWRWSSVFGGSPNRNEAISNYNNDLPVGHLVLLGSMLQILLLAALLIFLPLRKLAGDGLRTPGALRYFAYFGALGLGFMLIEIALMQKLVIFLGHPTYALSVVLTSLLASAGTGSLLAGRIEKVARKHILLILAGIVAAVLLDVFAVNHVLPMLLGQPLWLRMAFVIVLLIPTGLVLGMPFPSGMRLVEASCPHLVPWGWAVNAFFSVFGSIFCIVLSMAIGFSNVFYVAIGVYALGLLVMKTKGTPVVDVAIAGGAAAATGLWRPAGHFYSPIPDRAEVTRDAERIFGNRRRELPGLDLAVERQMALVRELTQYYGEEDFPEQPRADRRYCLANDFFPYGDAFFYYALLRHVQPKRVIEIGSGWSSAVLLDTDERFLGGKIDCTFIEPYPERLQQLLRPADIARTHLLPMRVQDVPLAEFDRLAKGDMLFVDSSHVCKTGSDVHHILFEILPRLPSGVWVHFHDVFANFEYVRSWVEEGRAWNESYFLRAFLTGNPDWTIELHASTLVERAGAELLPLLPKVAPNVGGSIWLRRR